MNVFVCSKFSNHTPNVVLMSFFPIRLKWVSLSPFFLAFTELIPKNVSSGLPQPVSVATIITFANDHNIFSKIQILLAVSVVLLLSYFYVTISKPKFLVQIEDTPIIQFTYHFRYFYKLNWLEMLNFLYSAGG